MHEIVGVNERICGNCAIRADADDIVYAPNLHGGLQLHISLSEDTSDFH